MKFRQTKPLHLSPCVSSFHGSIWLKSLMGKKIWNNIVNIYLRNRIKRCWCCETIRCEIRFNWIFNIFSTRWMKWIFLRASLIESWWSGSSRNPIKLSLRKSINSLGQRRVNSTGLSKLLRQHCVKLGMCPSSTGWTGSNDANTLTSRDGINRPSAYK